MKESATSLRWYFGVIGVWYLVSAGFIFSLLGGLGLSALLIGSALSTVNTIFGVVSALGDIYFAFTLPKYLNPNEVKYVKGWLLGTFGVSILLLIVGYLTQDQLSYFGVIVGSLLTWYLYVNVRRLANPPVPAPMRGNGDSHD